MAIGDDYNPLPVDEDEAVEEDNLLHSDNDESSDDSLIDSQPATASPHLHDK